MKTFGIILVVIGLVVVIATLVSLIGGASATSGQETRPLLGGLFFAIVGAVMYNRNKN